MLAHNRQSISLSRLWKLLCGGEVCLEGGHDFLCGGGHDFLCSSGHELSGDGSVLLARPTQHALGCTSASARFWRMMVAVVADFVVTLDT